MTRLHSRDGARYAPADDAQVIRYVMDRASLRDKLHAALHGGVCQRCPGDGVLMKEVSEGSSRGWVYAGRCGCRRGQR